MDSQILRLPILSLLVTVSFGLVTQLAEFNGTLPVYPDAQVLSPFYFNGFPGPALIEIQAASSVIVCVSPYTAISTNLAISCPNPINFVYNSPSVVNEFLLFLDDFSLNFLSQDSAQKKQNKRPEYVDIEPYAFQTSQVPLLQNTPYYISIGLMENIDNVTLRNVEQFYVENQYPLCGAGTVPNQNYDGTNKNGVACEELKSQLNNETSSTPPLIVSKKKPLIISFDVETFSVSAQLDFHILEKEYDFTIYIGFEFVPSETNYNIIFSNSSAGALLEESEFLGDIVQSFSLPIPNPKQGTYYALVTSNLTQGETNFNIEFNTTGCNLAANDCGTYNITTYLSNEANVTNMTITNTEQYFAVAVAGDNLIFGIDVNGSGNAFVQIDVNAIPTTSQNSTYQYNTSSLVTINFEPVSDNQVFVFGFVNANSFALDGFPALVWSGSICPGNCSSKGSCNATTTLCDCDSGYKGRYCETKESSKKKLSTLYIILIIIGGAILLAILIGVPVALFLNNRKKARYERV